VGADLVVAVAPLAERRRRSAAAHELGVPDPGVGRVLPLQAEEVDQLRASARSWIGHATSTRPSKFRGIQSPRGEVHSRLAAVAEDQDAAVLEVAADQADRLHVVRDAGDAGTSASIERTMSRTETPARPAAQSSSMSGDR
jgi:hypothetical protein